jgi:DNA end-binding protein Ku
MRAVWMGTIGFGSYAIPVKAYSATEDREIPLHQVHEADGGRVRVKRVCEVDGAEVPPEQMVRGYAVPGGDVVLLSDHELASLPMPGRTIAIRAFAPLADVDPIWFAKSYYLEPEPAGTKPYVLFSEALQQSGRIALVTVALRRRETLGALRVRDQVIVLETMLWPDEVRAPDFPFRHADVDIRPGELRRAVNLVEELTGEFDPGRYPDRYREAFQALVQAKIDGGGAGGGRHAVAGGLAGVGVRSRGRAQRGRREGQGCRVEGGEGAYDGEAGRDAPADENLRLSSTTHG